MCFDEMWEKVDRVREDLDARGYKRAPGQQLSYVNVDSHNTIIARATLEDKRFGEVRFKCFDGVSGVVYLKTRTGHNVLNEALKGHNRGAHSACAEAMILKEVEDHFADSRYENADERQYKRVLYMVSEYSPCSACEQKLTALRNAVYNLKIRVQYRRVFVGNFASKLHVHGHNDYTIPALLSGHLPGKIGLRRQPEKASTSAGLVLSNSFAVLAGGSQGTPSKAAAPKPHKPGVPPIAPKLAGKRAAPVKTKPLAPKLAVAAPNPLLTCSTCAKTRTSVTSWFYSRWHQCSGCDRVYCNTCGAGLNSVPHAMFTRERMCGACNTITALINRRKHWRASKRRTRVAALSMCLLKATRGPPETTPKSGAKSVTALEYVRTGAQAIQLKPR